MQPHRELSRSRLILYAATPLLLLVICILGLEEYARVKAVKPVCSPLAQADRNGTYEYDSELGWVPKKNVSYPRWEPDPRSFSIAIDSEGFRSNGKNTSQLSDKNPILIVGDSFTFGEEVDDEDTLPAQLQELTGRRVLNGGVSGYGLDQTVVRAERILKEKKTDTLIVSFISHDIERVEMSLFLGYWKPYFKKTDGSFRFVNPPSLENYSREVPFVLDTLRCSALLKMVMNKFDKNWYASHLEMPEIHVNHEGFEIAEYLIDRLVQIQKTYGVKVILVFQSDGIFKIKGRDVERYQRLFQKISDSKIHFLDLKSKLDSILDSELNSRKHYFKSYHMNKNGNRWVAEQIVKELNSIGAQN